MDMFPFGHLTDDEFLVLLSIDLPSLASSFPSFEITSGLFDLPNLSDYDIDKHMLQSIDSRYFTIPELPLYKCPPLNLLFFILLLGVYPFIMMN